jgi:hypothetical protein
MSHLILLKLMLMQLKNQLIKSDRPVLSRNTSQIFGREFVAALVKFFSRRSPSGSRVQIPHFAYSILQPHVRTQFCIQKVIFCIQALLHLSSWLSFLFLIKITNKISFTIEKVDHCMIR